MGWKIEKASDKRKLFGIDVVKRFRLNITNRSSNIIKELNSYKWKEKNGSAINEPIETFDHGMDALRYLAVNKLAEKNKGKYAIQ
jgi:phage terminase large subunit